jgi:hypothetical protein
VSFQVFHFKKFLFSFSFVRLSRTRCRLRIALIESREISDGRYLPISNHEGISLLRNAGYEAQQAHTDTRLVRSLYINGLLYLLEALPGDLSSEEVRSVQSRLPEPIKSALLARPATPAGEQEQGPADDLNAQCARLGRPDPSLLHRLLSTCIVCCFLVIQFLIPYAKTLLRNVYHYERSHRITERLVSATLDAADRLGKGGVNLGSAMSGLGKGRVGAALSGLAAWWIEGVAGGIYEGVGEGMVVLGAVRSANTGSNGTINYTGTAGVQRMSSECF